MKGFPQYFLPVVALLFLAVFGSAQITAQNKPTNSYAKIKACFDKNEPAYIDSINQEPTPEVNAKSELLLETLINCVDNGLKIKTLSAKQRQALQTRKRRYISDRETAKFISCAAEKMIEVDTKITPEIDVRVSAKDKAGALERLQTARETTEEAKSCVQQALDSPLVPGDVKAQLLGTMERLDSLLASFTSLKKTLESMPDK